MKALLQRVSEARVTVEGEVVGEIDRGILVLLGIEHGDEVTMLERMADRLLAYRIFPDDSGRMNRSVADIGGGVLVVSQFTLAADTRSGLRPSFSGAAEPAYARLLYEGLLDALRARHAPVACGRFGADMKVALVNDGPVTFLLEL
jgi:D-tyrosyl-tRNA(Tyr) deacylase